MLDKLVHKWLRIPYILHIHDVGPPRPAATVVLVHGIASSHAVWNSIVKKLDTSKVRIISVDLLGFGASPKPVWQTYSTIIHARSLRLTLLKMHVKSPVILVGHSLGALVAIQYAKRYRRNVEALLLCGPPFYKPSKLAKDIRIARPLQADDTYHLLYRNSRYRQQLSMRLAQFMKSVRLTSRHFIVTNETMPAIVSSLEMSIENQTSLEDAKLLTVPIDIIYGRFDPFVLKSHIRELKTANKYASVTTLPVTHEIVGPIYKNTIVKHIDALVAAATQNSLPKKSHL